jgi:hypothetical protein
VLDHGWDRAALAAVAARIPNLALQASSEQRPHKISLSIANAATVSCEAFGEAVAALRLALDATRLPHELVVSSGVDVDILPRGANKGAALAMLLKELAAEEKTALVANAAANGGHSRVDVLGDVAERTLVCGDSGNDILLLAVEGVRACAVGNAQPELRAWAEEHRSARIYAARATCADGIVEAMKHFGFLLDGATVSVAAAAEEEEEEKKPGAAVTQDGDV